MDLIDIQTKRYAAVVKAFYDQHPDVTVRIDRKIETRPVAEWCTNKTFLSIRDFSMSASGQTILSFHDHPRELFADIGELPFVETLVAKKLLRFTISKEKV